MIFVSTEQLTEGMVLARTIYGMRGEELLKAGQKLTASHIRKIREMGYNGVYVAGDQSEENSHQDFINHALRIEAVNQMKTCCEKIRRGLPYEQDIYNLKKTLADIVDEIVANRDKMVNSIDVRTMPDYLYFHSVNVAVLSTALGVEIEIPKKDLYELGVSALFHDIGKVFLPKDLLFKNNLTEEEKKLIRTHPERGFNFLKYGNIASVRAYVGVLEHHEKMDGSGYPKQKKGNEIYLFARIISIADTYDNLTANIFNGVARKPSEAVEYIMGNGNICFDLELATAFVRKIAPYPIGTKVKLSNSMVGVVVENSKSFCMRPTVKIIQKDGTDIEPFLLDLKSPENRSVTIEEVLS